MRRRGGSILPAAPWLLIGTLCLAIVVPKAEAAPLLPHRAVYVLTLGENRGGQVTDARGQLLFEWADVCDGWSVRQRTRIVVTSTQGVDIDSGWTLSSWESKDGLTYRFFSRRLLAGQKAEELRGTARLKGPGLGGEAIYSAPEDRRVALPAGTLFPTEHSRRLLDSAERRELPDWKLVFDGGGEKGLYGVAAALVRALPGEAERNYDSPLLDALHSWRLRLAFFPMDREAIEPEHEQALRIFANGVVDELTLDYGDFSLVARLQELEALPANCG